VSQERRKHTRILKPIDGRWGGGAASGQCRIGDLGLGGCFVHSLSAPRVGDSTSVSFVTHEGQKLELDGTVVHVEPRIGFSVEFREIAPEEAHDLTAFIEYLQKA
jgi:hypothetical protein